MTSPSVLTSVVPPSVTEGLVHLEYPVELAIWAIVGLGGILTGLVSVLIVEHRLTVARRRAESSSLQTPASSAPAAQSHMVIGHTGIPLTVQA